MTEPSRTSPASEKADTDSQGPLDPTHPRAEGGEPNFAAPERAGEVGQLGRYRVLQKLGQGGMGAVYLGYDEALERKVALKVMLPEHAANSDARERFLREARAAAKVKSDHVVTIHDVGEERGVPFIAMEYLLGSPLDQYLKTKGELPLAQVLRVVRETATGLAAAHKLGLVHRDIKPGNIWLEAPHGRVKILDFGLARPVNDDVHLTDSGAVVGTPAYMSPEQARGQKLDHRSDLFSLGVMLYRLCTGKMPFTGDSTMAVLTALAVDTPTPPRQHNPQLPEALEAVINRLLAKDPAARFQTAKEVADALRDIEHPKTASGPLPVVVALPVQPMVVGAQTQNVWEGIEDSGSVAVPLATSAEQESPSVPDPKPQRTKPERKVSKLPAILAGAALLIACAVLAGILLWPKKPKEESGAPEVGDKGKQPPVIVSDPDRKAAEYVLSIGGVLRVTDKDKDIQFKGELPKDRFSLTHVNLHGNNKVTDAGVVTFKDCDNLTNLSLNLTQVSDAALAHLKDCKSLTYLDVRKTKVTKRAVDELVKVLPACKIEWGDPDRKAAEWAINIGGGIWVNGQPADVCASADLPQVPFALTSVNLTKNKQVSDADLAQLKDCKNLKFLWLKDTDVGDVGLAQLKDCKALIQVILDDTKVTDKGLELLAGFGELIYLEVRRTKVTKEGIEKLAKALPKCGIVWDGGIIEPKKADDPDRKAAEWVLSLGGDVKVKDDTRTITKPADLPAAFRLTSVGLKKTAVGDADLIRFQKLPELTTLDLSETAVTNEGLTHVGEIKTLRSVLLGSCPKVTDAGMKHLRKLPLLNNLSLVETSVGDAGLRDLAGQPLLYYVYLSNTKVTDDGLPHLAKLPELLGLHLNSLPVTDAGLAHLTGCKKLRALELVQTGITDDGLKHLEKITTLRVLNMKQTKVTKAAVEKLAAALPQCKIEWDGPTIEPKAVADPDRRAAEYVLSIGGTVRVNAATNDIKAKDELPKDRFTLVSVNLSSNKNVTDVGLANFEGCKNLTSLNLLYTSAGDAGLAHFKDCKNLTRLYLTGTKVGDAGLAHFKDCKNLAHLVLSETQVSNVGLDLFEDCKDLVVVNVRKTKVTAEKVAEFRKALPKCIVEYEDIVEPKK